jgi:hypothetical protein
MCSATEQGVLNVACVLSVMSMTLPRKYSPSAAFLNANT